MAVAGTSLETLLLIAVAASGENPEATIFLFMALTICIISSWRRSSFCTSVRLMLSKYDESILMLFTVVELLFCMFC